MPYRGSAGSSPLREVHQNYRQVIEQSGRGTTTRHELSRRTYQSVTINSTGKENNHNQVRHDSTSATRVIEQSKAVTALTAGTTSIMCAEGIHDSIISTYRNQIQNHGHLESLYETLRARIAEV